ncbi:MAG TPA: SRPBCC family protein, partial [Solirubrobacterales bacterium]|nr:SRPBCC family protein [Solirubrobacterales bacterium]
EVTAWLRDLQAAWEAELDRDRVTVEPAAAARTYEAEFDAPQAIVWDWITSPARRIQWQDGATGIDVVAGPAGRRGVGTVNHCIHGKDTIVEEVLDWRPFDYVTYRSQLPQPGVPKIVNSFVLTDLGDDRTRVELRFGWPRSAKERAIAKVLLPMLDDSINRGLAALRPLIEAAAAESRATSAAVAEPELPAANGRNLSQPIGAGA